MSTVSLQGYLDEWIERAAYYGGEAVGWCEKRAPAVVEAICYGDLILTLFRCIANCSLLAVVASATMDPYIVSLIQNNLSWLRLLAPLTGIVGLYLLWNQAKKFYDGEVVERWKEVVKLIAAVAMVIDAIPGTMLFLQSLHLISSAVQWIPLLFIPGLVCSLATIAAKIRALSHGYALLQKKELLLSSEEVQRYLDLGNEVNGMTISSELVRQRVIQMMVGDALSLVSLVIQLIAVPLLISGVGTGIAFGMLALALAIALINQVSQSYLTNRLLAKPPASRLSNVL